LEVDEEISNTPRVFGGGRSSSGNRAEGG